MLSRGTRAIGLAALLVATLTVGVTLGGVDLAGDGPTGTAAAAQPTEIDGCATISEPGVYVLTTDITDGGGGGNFTFISETCIRIGASDVTLRGGGHLVDGRGISDTTAVGATSSTPLRNVTVSDLRITDWNRGVYLRNTADATVRNVRTSGTSFGVFVENADGTTIRDTTADRGFIGVYLGNTSDTTTENNSFAGNHVDGLVRDDNPSNAWSGTDAPSNSSIETDAP